ncbi:MAG: outer membrane protein assembly factor BamD [Thermodesulfobacteriota bacterium]
MLWPIYVAVILFSLVVFSGCASLKAVKENYRNAEEMYKTGVKQYNALHYEDAEQTFEKLMERYPLSPYALDGEIMLADVLYVDEKYDEARVYYTDFVALHPSHAKASYALFQKGMCYFRNILAPDRDQTNTRKAIIAFEDLTKQFPRSSYNDKAEELIAFLRMRLAQREVYVGRFYLKKKNYKGALARFKVVLKDYPESGEIDEILYYIVKSYSELGEAERARDVFSTLRTDYPGSSYTKAAGKIIGG